MMIVSIFTLFINRFLENLKVICWLSEVWRIFLSFKSLGVVNISCCVVLRSLLKLKKIRKKFIWNLLMLLMSNLIVRVRKSLRRESLFLFWKLFFMGFRLRRAKLSKWGRLKWRLFRRQLTFKLKKKIYWTSPEKKLIPKKAISLEYVKFAMKRKELINYAWSLLAGVREQLSIYILSV